MNEDAPKRATAQEYIAKHQVEVARHFANHRIRERSPGRWLVQRRYPDDKEWDTVFGFEVIVLWGGKLLVHGDIDPAIFAYYGKYEDPEQVLRWMGGTSDLSYYVAQKARIGMGSGKADALLELKDEGVWIDQALGYIEDRIASEGGDPVNLDPATLDWESLPAIPEKVQALIQEILDGRNPNEVLQDPDHMSADCYEAGAFQWGDVPSHRLIYAHEALRRLVQLLDEEKLAQASTEATGVGA